MITSAPPTPSPAADLLSRLVLRSADGDEAAFAEFYARTRVSVHRTAFQVLRTADLAAEVSQEVYLEVWRRVAAHYDPTQGSVLAWLTVMTRRRSIDRVRRIQRGVALDRRYHATRQVVERDVVWDSVSTGSDRTALRAALDRLTPLQRDTLVLVYYGGRTQAEVAHQMNVPLGTAKTRIRNALIRLRLVIGVEAVEAA